MKKSLLLVTLLFSFVFGSLVLARSAQAEERTYGYITLTGLARNSWPYNPPGWANAMVCNVNGDGFLAIRECAGTGCRIVRKLERLAVLQVNTQYRQGRWIYVGGAYRNHDKNGYPINPSKTWNIQGWAHDGYMCDFLD